MTAGGGDFERPLDVLLSFDVVEVRVVVRVLIEQIVEINMGGFDMQGAVEKLNDLRQVAYPKNFDFAHDGGLRSVLFGQDDPSDFFLLRRHGDRQRAAHWL